MIEVYIDGSSKGNPGPGGAGIVIKNAAAQEMLSRHGIPLGHVTNNQAEGPRHLRTAHQDSNGLATRRRDLLPELEGPSELGIGDGDQRSRQRLSSAHLRLRQGTQR